MQSGSTSVCLSHLKRQSKPHGTCESVVANTCLSETYDGAAFSNQTLRQGTNMPSLHTPSILDRAPSLLSGVRPHGELLLASSQQTRRGATDRVDEKIMVCV